MSRLTQDGTAFEADNLASGETALACPVPRQPPLTFHAQAESGDYPRAPLSPLAFRDGVHLLANLPSGQFRLLSGLARLRTDDAIHCGESALPRASKS